MTDQNTPDPLNVPSPPGDAGTNPHAISIGIQALKVTPGKVTAKIAYNEKLVGDPTSGVIHGGVITALLDDCSGSAVNSASDVAGAIATLDLRIDYMRPATPKRDIFAFCHCFRITKSVAFVRGVAYHDDPEDPIATSTAAFMLGTPRNIPQAGQGKRGKDVS